MQLENTFIILLTVMEKNHITHFKMVTIDFRSQLSDGTKNALFSVGFNNSPLLRMGQFQKDHI
jgi:hypothetical protein